MKAQEYLEQIYVIDQKLKRMQYRREEIRAQLYSVKSPTGNMSADRVQSSITGDKLERLIARCDELERDIVNQMRYLRWARHRISREIEQVRGKDQKQTERLITVLHDRYERFMTWEQIAVEMDITCRYVHILHGIALQRFREVKKNLE